MFAKRRQNWQQRQQQWHQSRATSLQPLLPITLVSSGPDSSVPTLKAGIWHCAMLLNTSDRPLVIHLLYGEYEHFRWMKWYHGDNCTCISEAFCWEAKCHRSEKNLYEGEPQGLYLSFFFLIWQLNKIQLSKISVSFSQARERAIDKSQMLKRRW